MSHYDYRQSITIATQCYPFYALIMAAMRQADDINAGRLQSAFPMVWTELCVRTHSPEGWLPGKEVNNG